MAYKKKYIATDAQKEKKKIESDLIKAELKDIKEQIEGLAENIESKETQSVVKSLLSLISKDVNNYSIGNQFLLMKQEESKNKEINKLKEESGIEYVGPDKFEITNLKTFPAWKKFFEEHLTEDEFKKMGSFIKTNTKSLSVITPKFITKYEKDSDGNTVLDAQDKPIAKLDDQGNKEFFISSYSKVALFDISDTKAEELGLTKDKILKFRDNDANLNNETYILLAEHLRQISDITVEIKGDVKYSDYDNFSKTLILNEDLPNSEKISETLYFISLEAIKAQAITNDEIVLKTLAHAASYSLGRMYGIDDKVEIELKNIGSSAEILKTNLKIVSEVVNQLSNELDMNRGLTPKDYKEINQEKNLEDIPMLDY